MPENREKPLSAASAALAASVAVAASPAALDGLSDEADLVTRLKAGDDAAYELLVRTLTPLLLAVARRVSRSEADAQDAVQEAFLSAFQSMGSFDGRSTLGTWLHRIVVNAALMKNRKASSRRESSIEELLPQFDGGLHKQQPAHWRSVTAEGGIGIKEKEALMTALGELPEEYRTVIVLKDIEGLESRQVALSLGISDASVRQRLHRGRQALVTLLSPTFKETSS